MTSLIPYQPQSETAVAVVTDSDAVQFALDTFRDVGVSRGDLTRIKTPSGGGTAFQVPGIAGDSYEPTIECTIGFAKMNQRAWYAVPFSASGGGTRPSCSSEDGVNARGFININEAVEALARIEGGEEVELPENRCGIPGKAGCCPWNEWGSRRRDDGSESKGKDCGESVHIFLYMKDQVLPILLTIGSTSVKPFKDYVIGLVKTRRRVTSVVTRIGIEPDTTDGGLDYSKLTFQFVADVPEESRERWDRLAKETATKFASFRDDEPETPRTATPETPSEEPAEATEEAEA